MCLLEGGLIMHKNPLVRKAYLKAYYEKNKEKLASQGKKYRKEHKEVIQEYNKQYRIANAEKLKEYGKQYREMNAERLKETSKEYAKNNKTKLQEYKKQYYATNRDRILSQRKEDRQLNKAKYRAINRAYYMNNKDKIKVAQKQYYEDNLEQIKATKRKYYETHKDMFYTDEKKEKVSICCGHKKELSPNQNKNMINLPSKEKFRIISKLKTSTRHALNTNNSSTRKGVCYLKRDNKWLAYLEVDGIKYHKSFDTEQEAIDYREFLEDKYYTDEQKFIRNKYSKC